MLIFASTSFSAGVIHTIQIASFKAEKSSLRGYDEMLKVLKEDERAELRIEKVGRYYALRVGKFQHPAGDRALFQRVKSLYPDALILESEANHSVIKVYAGKAGQETVSAVPVPVPAAVPAPIVAVQEPVAPPVEVVVVRPAIAATSHTGTGSAILGSPALEDFSPADEAAEAGALVSDTLLITFSAAIFLLMGGFYLRELSRLGHCSEFFAVFTGVPCGDGLADGPETDGEEKGWQPILLLKSLREWLGTLGAPRDERSGMAGGESAAARPAGDQRHSMMSVAPRPKAVPAEEVTATVATVISCLQANAGAFSRDDGRLEPRRRSFSGPSAFTVQSDGVDSGTAEENEEFRFTAATSATILPAESKIQRPTSRKPGNRLQNALEAAYLGDGGRP